MRPNGSVALYPFPQPEGLCGCFWTKTSPNSFSLRSLICIPNRSMFACWAQEVAPDDTVWRLAKEHGCALVTRDQDFLRLSMVRGAPPKVVWLDVGNCSNQDLIRLLRARATDIEQFDKQDMATFLTLGF